ncbi:hypothetical protein [Paenibacillus sp. UMB4589-SE434]|uniref:hypothetical protein n=1 Tax=Paenibacillus sp. UMB4589-SE434 TaxID=3046314 RepID=UPI00254A3415|nr:hypothetical protein [Paenibacillus sp. UMB4589-SE434]MDK8183768.1 hypothetical protein [Paenibacillus sp. UMB4589-SE434]
MRSKIRKPRRVLMAGLVLILTVWVLMQLYTVLFDRELPGNAERSLYEVVNLNMRMLEGATQRASKATTSADWNEWKTNVYAASFAHERLIQAVGGKALPKLPSLQQIEDYITIAQISGDKPLSEAERKMAAEAVGLMAQICQKYEGIMNMNGQLISSKIEELAFVEKRLQHMLILTADAEK